MAKPTIEDVSDEHRERGREAIARILRRKESLSVDRVQDLSGLKRATAATVLRAHRAGQLPDPGAPGNAGRWAAAGPEEGQLGELVSLVSAAESEEDLREAARATTTALASGRLPVAQANGIEKLLARQGALLRQQREAPDEEAKLQRVVAGREAFALVRAFEGMVCDSRRERVLRYIVDEFQADLAEHPPVDTGTR